MTQRIINDTFWTDPYIEDLDPSEKLIFLYLLTNPLCNIAWAYEIKMKRIAYETWFDKDMVDKILTRFEEEDKIMRAFDWIILKNFAKNQSTNPNVKKWMQRIIDNIPERVQKALKGFESLPYFTLLNLTLPNLTILNSKEDEKSDDFPTSSIIIKKSKEEVIKEKTENFLELTKVINREIIKENYKITDQEFDKIWKEFIMYWTEPNKSKTKIKYDWEKTFEVNRRFIKFIENDKKWNKWSLWSNKWQWIRKI